MSGIPEEAFAIALASLPGFGAARLRSLLATRPPSAAWQRVLDGSCDEDGRPPGAGAHRSRGTSRVSKVARRTDVVDVWRRHQRAHIAVLLPGHDHFPPALLEDRLPPAVLLARGRTDVIGSGPAVTIVGTRSATRYGLGVAAELGAGLTALGVSVVSGLALGVDGAAHEGAVARSAAGHLGGGPIGVVAGGLDHPYPARHARLWERVADVGVILSEAPIGIGHQRWRFPQRNRLLAALLDVVVVVECHARGGSILTVDAALARGIPVGVVPGSVRSPASAGTNQLLVDGAFPVRDVSDVVVALDLVRPGVRLTGPALAHPAGGPEPTARSAPSPRAPELDGHAGAVLAALEWEPISLEQVLTVTGLSVADAALALEHLVSRGLADGAAGWWSRR